MKIVFEAYISVFIISLCVLLCACLISADIEVAGARDAYATYTSQLQDSNFASKVIDACKADANVRGYTINITIYDDGTGNKSGNVELAYNYTIKALGYSATRYIRGYVS